MPAFGEVRIGERESDRGGGLNRCKQINFWVPRVS